jgi:hypothetical protein
MNIFEKLLGRNAQTVEQPINFAPLQPNPNLGQDGLPMQQTTLTPMMVNQNGELMPQNENNVNTQTISTGLMRKPETTGIMQDLAAGFRDNYNNPIAVNNFRPDSNKSIANRLGEAAGTAGRVLNSPLGRGLAMGGIVAATGGSPLQALAYGGSAGVKNQQLATQDKMYRKALQDEGLDTSNISGYIDSDMYKNYSMGKYRTGSLAIKQQLGLMNDSRSRAKMIFDGYKNNMISGSEAVALANEYGVPISQLTESNQTRNADINEIFAPARKEFYESGIPYRQVQTQKALNDLYKPYGDRQLKTQEALNNIDYAEGLIRDNKNLVGVYSPATSTLGRLSGGTLGMSKEELGTRGEIARSIGTIKNNLIAQARSNGQTGINTMTEINQATAGLDENSSAEELLGALKAMRNIAERIQTQQPENLSPFVPNVNLTPIQQPSARQKNQSQNNNTNNRDPLGLGI